jgi:hypothetical protein
MVFDQGVDGLKGNSCAPVCSGAWAVIDLVSVMPACWWLLSGHSKNTYIPA